MPASLLTSQVLVVFILCGTMMVEEPLVGEGTQYFVQVFIFGLLLAAIVVPVCAGGIYLLLGTVPARWTFFITHHKVPTTSWLSVRVMRSDDSRM